MRRYGDNVTNEDIFEDRPDDGENQQTRVFLGGCAATFGSFPGPVKVPKMSQKKDRLAGLLSFLGVKQKRSQEA